MGGTAKKIGRGIAGVATGGLSEIALRGMGNDTVKRGLTAGLTGGISEAFQKNPYGLNIHNPIPGLLGIGGQPSSGGGVTGPFSIDANQMAADQSAITSLGKKQYDQTMGELPRSVTNGVLQSLPGIEEKLNSQHLLNSTALHGEIARKQQELAQNIAMPAMQSLQGTQTGALQRGLSIEDFINQSNVAKTIGAQMAPPPPSGKQNFGTFAQGAGALAPLLGK